MFLLILLTNESLKKLKEEFLKRKMNKSVKIPAWMRKELTEPILPENFSKLMATDRQ